jgi:hypothetical protein
MAKSIKTVEEVNREDIEKKRRLEKDKSDSDQLKKVIDVLRDMDSELRDRIVNSAVRFYGIYISRD